MAFESLTDARIQELLRMPKVVTNPAARNIVDANHDRRDYVVESDSGAERFKLFVRQNKTIGDDFSCGLQWLPPGGESLILARYNGSSHEHPNKLEGTKLSFVCHIHQTTERYIQGNLKPEGFAAAEAAKYQTCGGALHQLVTATSEDSMLNPIIPNYFNELRYQSSERPALQNALWGRTIHQTRQGFLQIRTPFTFTDGDTFQVYLQETSGGGVRLTDFGHTLMQLSYENDLAKLREGTRGKLFDQVLATAGMREENGQLLFDSNLENLGRGVLQFGQGLTRIYNLSFLNRARVASTFYEDLKERLYSLVAPEKIQPDYVVDGEVDTESYPIDYRIQGRRLPLFLFGIAGRDKARLVTIVLEHWLRAKIDFDSLLIFHDQQDIPRRDLARLSNVGGEMVASLDASEDFQRKILKLAA